MRNTIASLDKTVQGPVSREDAQGYANLAADIAALAQNQVCHYPQYIGYFDAGWELCLITHSLRTKMGDAFDEGDLLLVRPRDQYGILGYFYSHSSSQYRKAWSFRNGCETSICSSAVQDIPLTVAGMTILRTCFGADYGKTAIAQMSKVAAAANTRLAVVRERVARMMKEQEAEAAAK